jgi:kinesin family protein 15
MNPSSNILHIREDIKQGVYVENLTQQVVTSSTEAVRMLRESNKNRHTAATAMNAESSRSHTVFTMTIESKVSVTTNDFVLEIYVSAQYDLYCSRS